LVGVGDELSLLVTLLVAMGFPFLGKSLSWRELLATSIAKRTNPLASFKINFFGPSF